MLIRLGETVTRHGVVVMNMDDEALLSMCVTVQGAEMRLQ